MLLAGKYLVEKRLLDLFPPTRLGVAGPWQVLSDIKGYLLLIQATTPRELDMLVAELYEDGIFEFFEDNPSWGVLRLSGVGRIRRFELGYYLTEITFRKKDGRHTDDEGNQVGCIWVETFLNDVSWGGEFPESHIQNLRDRLPLRHSLLTSRRTNRQITEAILAEFAPTTDAV